VGLLGKPHFVGVDANEKMHGWIAGLSATDSERHTVSPRTRGRIATCGGITSGAETHTGAAVVGQYRGASPGVRIIAGALSTRRGCYNNEQRPARQRCVRF